MIEPFPHIINANIIQKRNSAETQSLCVGFTCGAFDILHTGHALMLEEASNACDYLIVGVQSDPSIDRKEKNKPVQTYEERIIMVDAIKHVDDIMLYNTEEELFELLKQLKPDIRILGADWKGKKYTGSDLGIQAYFNSRNHGYSTSSLRKRIFIAELASHAEPYEMT